MSVPLDRLYNFLRDVYNHHDLIIYRFFPHGSRKIEDLNLLLPTNPFTDHTYGNVVIFHDQEPLNFDLYTNNNIEYLSNINECFHQVIDLAQIESYTSIINQHASKLNLKIKILPTLWLRPVILIHSEQRSNQVKRYESENFIGAYWWCHAIIARDWFRYAQHDRNLIDTKTITHDFLIYNRAWTGTREYRLKFIELLIQNNIANSCLTWFNSVDDGQNYRNHKFKNVDFQIENFDLEDYFDPTSASASASADYCSADYQRTNIEIVLETLFDDGRLHLTEKILRPMACAQPFILAATMGSLEYLRGYGFETFGDLIDESYDTMPDPAERLQAICIEMKRISQLPQEEKNQLFNDMKQIALKNQQTFFSESWHQSIIDEFKQNFEDAYNQFEQIIRYPV